jgi:hypothetical protein
MLREPHHDRAAEAGTRIDPHVVRQAGDGAEAVARAARRRVAIVHAAADIGHPAAAIQRQQFQSDTFAVVVMRRQDLPAAGMLQQVGGEFGDDDGDLGDARFGHTVGAREAAHPPTRFGYLACFGDGSDHVISNAPG